jgi:hypothetical protein
VQVRKVLHKDRKFSFNADKTTECIGSYSESHVVYAHALALVCTFSLVNHTSEPITPRLGSHFLQVRCNHHRHQIIIFSNKNLSCCTTKQTWEKSAHTTWGGYSLRLPKTKNEKETAAKVNTSYSLRDALPSSICDSRSPPTGNIGPVVPNSNPSTACWRFQP